MYVITTDNRILEVEGGFEKQLKHEKVKAVVITNPQDPANKFCNQILSWCSDKQIRDDFESNLQSVLAVLHEQ